MTIEYFATRIAKHISVQAIWPNGRTEIIAVLPRDALSGLVTRNNQLIHIAFDAMGTRNRETVLIDKQEHNADQILTAIDSCLRLNTDGTPLQQNTFVPWHNRQRCAVRNGNDWLLSVPLC
ncbi:hypothetical protein ECP029970676_5316 [Escherichia coli P02997067.6]|nr:hypothetical protein ECP029970676_5316 [Escherichia coli P02997067.6]